MPEETLQITPASEWGKKKQAPADRGFICELPSGSVVRVLRTMDMMALLRAGKIPNPLAGIVQSMIDKGNTDFSGALKASASKDGNRAAQQLLDLLDATWMRAVIEPEFDAPEPMKKDETHQQYMDRLALWEPEEGKISIFDVDLNDKYFVFAVAQGGAADLARFRAEQDAALELVHSSDGVQLPSE